MATSSFVEIGSQAMIFGGCGGNLVA